MRKKPVDKVDVSTGGYAFSPNSMGSTVAICELETVLCLENRPPFPPRPLVMTRQIFKSISAESVLSILFEFKID
jgi:hypothetical protein